jgi:hypothetical protein
MVVEFKGESLTCSKSLPNELSNNFLETLEFTTMPSEAIPRPTVVVKNNYWKVFQLSAVHQGKKKLVPDFNSIPASSGKWFLSYFLSTLVSESRTLYQWRIRADILDFAVCLRLKAANIN